MECSHCRHDETARPSADAAVRCDDDPGRLLDDPELMDDLRRARRLLRIDPPHEDHAPLGLAELFGPDRGVGQALLAAGKTGMSTARGRPRKARRRRSGSPPVTRLWGALTWLVVCAGGMALTFGAGLLACAKLDLARELTHRDDLWNWGLLTALAGQFLLFLGFALRRSRGRAAPKGHARARRRVSNDGQVEQPHLRPSPTVPPWSPRCEAVLGLSLDAIERI